MRSPANRWTRGALATLLLTLSLTCAACSSANPADDPAPHASPQALPPPDALPDALRPARSDLTSARAADALARCDAVLGDVEQTLRAAFAGVDVAGSPEGAQKVRDLLRRYLFDDPPILVFHLDAFYPAADALRLCAHAALAGGHPQRAEELVDALRASGQATPQDRPLIQAVERSSPP